jgi:hypothetical protein
MVNEFARRYPDAAALAATDPIQAASKIDDVVVEWLPDSPQGACEIGGLYDHRVVPPRITIGSSGNARRDGFTAMHEIGHHLLATDSTWLLEDRFSIEGVRQAEETIVDAFAAAVLIPESVAGGYLSAGIDSRALVELMRHTPASPTACCVRALKTPGDRLVLLMDPSGKVWYSGSTGEPRNPGKAVPQPALVRAVEQATLSGGHAVAVGGEGIHYASGWVDTDVKVDVSLLQELAVIVCTATAPDPRLRPDSSWEEICPRCDSEFTPERGTRPCAECGEYRCPECGRCGCVSTKCASCFLELTAVDVSNGETLCENCR